MSSQEWLVYREIDWRFPTAGDADKWLRQKFGTANPVKISWQKLRIELEKLPTVNAMSRTRDLSAQAKYCRRRRKELRNGNEHGNAKAGRPESA